MLTPEELVATVVRDRELDAARAGLGLLGAAGEGASACCHKRCVQPVVEGTTRCEKHTLHHRSEVALRSRHRRAVGKCGLCGRDAVPGKARCEAHDSSRALYKCGACREYGHNRRTCPVVLARA